MIFIRLIALAAGTQFCAVPQTFDVASVKTGALALAGGEGAARERIEHSPLSLTMRNVSLASALQWACGLREFQILGPDWRFSAKYDIAAKTGEPASLEKLKLMLRSLLAARFQLVSHPETRQMTLYDLTVAKNGSRLRPAWSEGEARMTVNNGSFVFRHTSMQTFADNLASLKAFEGRPVFDRTGIPGLFDFEIKFADTTEEMRKAAIDGDGSSVIHLVQQQLGLKLEARKGPVEVLVIDHAERVPTAN